MRSLRTVLLFMYKKLLAFTGVLPQPVRSWIDTGCSLVLLKVANVDSQELEATLDTIVDALLAKEKAEDLGDYLEFGVCFGWSLSSMYRVAQRRRINQMRFIGFDSFEGLPPEAATDDDGYWSPGMFKSDVRITDRILTKAGVDRSRVRLVKGWFGDTLNDVTVEKLHLRKASIIMVDCDMYLSAREALDFCGPLIRDEAIVIFDDWSSGGLDKKKLGEKRAFDEFLTSKPEFSAEPIAQYGPNSRVFRISRVDALAALQTPREQRPQLSTRPT